MITSVLILVLTILLFASLYFRKTSNYPPGPFRWPIIGNLHLLRKLSRKLGGQHHAFLELSRQYGSNVVALRFGSSNVVAVCGQEAIQKVLRSDEYNGRPWTEFIKLRNLGGRNGITMTDGPEWRELRGWVVRKLRVIGFGRREMSDLVAEEVSEILRTIEGGGVHRLKPIIAPAVINVLWTLATGKRFCGKEKLQYFVDVMDRRARAFDMSGGILSALPWMRHIAPESTGYNLLVTLNNELKSFLMEAIDEHKLKYTPDSENDLIDLFLGEMYSKNNNGNFTDDQLVMLLMDLFIAGLNTTATTLDFAFLNMVINQEAQERLHKEIEEVVGDIRSPDLNDKTKLTYTEAVLTESQRMCLITPIVGPRRVLEDTNLLGFDIPKNTTVLMNLWSIHMNPELYPEPDTFRPERFYKDGAYVSDDNLILFGEGKRRCPGEALARCASFLLFTGVMQRYNLLPVPGQEPPTLVRLPGLTISPKPYEVLLTPRRNVQQSTDSGKRLNGSI